MQSQVEWYRDNNSVYYRLKHVLGTVFCYGDEENARTCAGAFDDR